MDNDQALGYALLALKRTLEARGVKKSERIGWLEDFAGNLRREFDLKTEAEAGEEGLKLLKQ